MTQAIATRSGTLQAPQVDYILIDGSGSMQDKWWDSLAALDGFMNTLKAQNIASHGIVTVFCSRDLESIQRDSTIDTWPTFSQEPLGSHWGTTPLYDAINNMGRHLRELDPPRCSIVIITDGDENASHFTTAEQAKAILDWCRAKGWQITFLGANFDNTLQAKVLGANASNSIGVRKMRLADAGKALGEKRVRHALTGTDISFSDEEKEKFGGFLSDQSAK
jgi:hypothetical protein